MGWAELCEQWQSIFSDIQQLPQFHIHRCYFIITYERNNEQLHVFADASTKAYGEWSALPPPTHHLVIVEIMQGFHEDGVEKMVLWW